MPPTFKPLAFARVNAFAGNTPGIEFLSQDGFAGTPLRSFAGVYQLVLAEPSPDAHQIVVVVTRTNPYAGEISASVLVDKSIQVNSFDTNGAQVDTPFSILVYEATLKVPSN